MAAVSCRCRSFEAAHPSQSSSEFGARPEFGPSFHTFPRAEPHRMEGAIHQHLSCYSSLLPTFSYTPLQQRSTEQVNACAGLGLAGGGTSSSSCLFVGLLWACVWLKSKQFVAVKSQIWRSGRHHLHSCTRPRPTSHQLSHRHFFRVPLLSILCIACNSCLLHSKDTSCKYILQ